MTEKIGWKICLCDGRSAISDRREGGRIYKTGRWTRPKRGYGPLAVFASYEDAFAWSCRVALYPRDLIVRRCLYKLSQWRTLWYLTHAGIKIKSALTFPTGTKLADAVKCLE